MAAAAGGGVSHGIGWAGPAQPCPYLGMRKPGGLGWETGTWSPRLALVSPSQAIKRAKMMCCRQTAVPKMEKSYKAIDYRHTS